jgi:predicted nucleotidyltransferase
MSSGAMDQKAIIEKAKKDLAFLQEDVLGVLIFGSWATGMGHEMSDIDICVVAPSAEDKIALWRQAIAAIRDDLCTFELLPLYLKMAVIEQGIVVYSKDIPELYEYFYPFRRIWEDQKHRQALNREEVREMLGRAC